MADMLLIFARGQGVHRIGNTTQQLEPSSIEQYPKWLVTRLAGSSGGHLKRFSAEKSIKISVKVAARRHPKSIQVNRRVAFALNRLCLTLLAALKADW